MPKGIRPELPFLLLVTLHRANWWLGNVPDQLGLVGILEDDEVGHQNPDGKGQS